MLILVALGGNAILRRGEPLTADAQLANVRVAVRAIAAVARDHHLVLTHGNGPQVGHMALQAATCHDGEPYPLDIIGAATAGMIGYMIEQEIGNTLDPEIPLATLLTRVEVDPEDPAFRSPSKFIGPVYNKAESDDLARSRGWTFGMDGDKWRRVVPSPMPKSVIWHSPIQWLLDKGTLLLCAGGGGIPVVFRKDTQTFVGVEAVVDKDLVSGLLARELEADVFVIATDVEGVYQNYGTGEERIIRRTTPRQLELYEFPPGSIAPKVDAACRFVRETGNNAIIGSLENLRMIIDGKSGTIVEPDGALI